jgi:uroporphyrinogen-III synthase
MGGSAMKGAIALLRPLDAARRSAALIQAMGYRPMLAPVTRIAASGAQPPTGAFDAILAASARAFEFLSGESLARLASTPLFAVGDATAAAASARGFKGQQTIAPDAVALAPLLIKQLPSGARLLYLAARDRKAGLESALDAAGIEAQAVEMYRAEARACWSEDEARGVRQSAAALHYSSRGAALGVELAVRAGFAELFRALIHVCLSADVSEPLRRAGATSIVVASQPREEALFDALQAAVEPAP